MQHQAYRTRRPAGRIVAALLVAATIALGLPLEPAAAQQERVLVVEGRGWGHGRGLGQHGALGYAVDHGWDWRQILAHYYGGTVEGNTGAASHPPVPDTVGLAVAGQGGYWIATAQGGVVTRDGAPFFGSMGDQRLNAPVLGIAAPPRADGYWLVASDGGIFTFGNAHFHGSTGGMRLNRPVVGMASTGTGGGYWLVATDGGVFSFGDARFHGSTGSMRLNAPVVGMAATTTGGGYWLVASDGGIFTFGDAPFYGSTGGMALDQPIVGMSRTPTGNGYWLVSRSGRVFAFGDAQLHGSLPDRGVAARVVGLVPSRGGNGYWVVTADGRAHPFGDASVSISVRLTAQAGRDLIVWRPNGGLRTSATAGVAPAWRVRPAGAGWLVDRGETCAGPWTQVTPTPVAAPAVEVSAVDPRDASGDHRDLLGVCRVDGTPFYRGQIHAYRQDGVVQARNVVDLELYLQGVVPRESPASWGDLGGGRGIQALAAQAVAARSYAWAEDRSAGAKTCDTTSCQVYGGAFLLAPSGSVTALEDRRTNQAIQMTAGTIRLRDGRPARTEFSSSTGGHTAGGTFPAVVDLGDSAPSIRNRVHAWTEQVKVSAIEAAWPQIGGLLGVDVVARNGLGTWGGRVLSMRLNGTHGAVQVTGDEFRSRLSATGACTKVGTTDLPQCMKSTWINIVGGPTTAPASVEAPSALVPAHTEGELQQ